MSLRLIIEGGLKGQLLILLGKYQENCHINTNMYKVQDQIDLFMPINSQHFKILFLVKILKLQYKYLKYR